MTAISGDARLTPFAGIVPARGTYGIKANVLIRKGAQVGLDSAGRAMPADTIANGCLEIVGKSSATYDNRTGSKLGGAADAVNVEVEFGVFGWISKTGGGDDIAEKDVTSACFAVDDQTVALTSNGDLRPISGIICEARNGQVWVWQGPHVSALVAMNAADEADIDTLQAQVAALIVDTTTTKAQVNIPLMSALVVSTGAPLAAFADAEGSVPGSEITNSKCPSVRWNDHATPAAIMVCVPVPQDLDDTQNVVLKALVSKVGATLADATKLTVGVFEIVPGALVDADVDFGGDTGAVVGDATSKTVTTLSLTLGLADIHPAPEALAFSIKPKAGTLGTDDLVLHACWLEYTRKEMTS